MIISDQSISCADLLKQFPQHFTDVIGDRERRIHGVSAPDHQVDGTAVFLITGKALTHGIDGTPEGCAAVLVVSPANSEVASAKRGDRTILIAKHVDLAMAAVINHYFLASPYKNKALQGVHPTAVIGSDCEIATGVRIGAHAFIGNGVKIGENCYIGANAVIEDECTLGAGTTVHPLVFVGHSVEIGRDCELQPHCVIGKEGFGYANDERFNHYRIPHQGRVVLEDDVHIGSCVTIDRGTFRETRIQKGAKLDNQIQIGHNCAIGRNSLLTAGFSVAGSTKIGANFVAGGRTSVTGHINVCDNVQVAALSGISKDISEPGQFGGLPLVPIQQFVKIKAAMVQLPEMRRQLTKILKHLGLQD